MLVTYPKARKPTIKNPIIHLSQRDGGCYEIPIGDFTTELPDEVAYEVLQKYSDIVFRADKPKAPKKARSPSKKMRMSNKAANKPETGEELSDGTGG